MDSLNELYNSVLEHIDDDTFTIKELSTTERLKIDKAIRDYKIYSIKFNDYYDKNIKVDSLGPEELFDHYPELYSEDRVIDIDNDYIDYDDGNDYDSGKIYKNPYDETSEGKENETKHGKSYIEPHHNRPINNDEVNFLLEHDKFYCYRHRRIKDTFNKYKEVINLCEDERIKSSYDWVKKYMISIMDKEVNEESILKEFQDHLKISVESYKIQKKYMMSNINIQAENQNISENFDKHLSRIHSFIDANKHILLKEFKVMKFVEHIKDSICYKEINMGKSLKYKNLSLDNDLFYIKIKKSSLNYTIDQSNDDYFESEDVDKDFDVLVAGPTSLLMCVLDNMQAKFNLSLYWTLCDSFTKYYESIFEKGNCIYNYFEKLREKIGSDVYKILKNWDSLITGYIAQDQVKDLGFKTLYEDIKKDISDLEKKHDFKFDYDLILPNLESSQNIKLNMELTGLSKSFGHPVLDVKKNFDKLREFGSDSKHISIESINEILGIFIRDFSNNYFNKHRKWPSFKNIPKEFNHFISRNLKMPHKFKYNYQLWSEVEFNKIFDFDDSPDTSERLKDSAGSPGLDNWFHTYDHCAFKNLYNQSKPKTKNMKPNRTMQRFLEGDERDVKRVIDDRSNMTYSSEDLLAKLQIKERELGDGRLFVSQSYHQRLYQTSIEHNIDKFVFKYVPEQTMTESEVQQLRRFMNTIHAQGERYEVVNLDLKKWNLFFRHVLVTLFGKVLDDMFGLKNVYEYNHIWFMITYLVSSSRFKPPKIGSDGKPEIGDYCIYGHLGGLEGMRQKLWTLITQCIIKYVAEKLGIAINIMCQGDNQVVVIKWNKSQMDNKDTLRELFLRNLKEAFEHYHLKLKKEETWYSKRMFEYSKVRYLDGEAVSYSTKKCSRLIPDINDGIASDATSFSTINTTTESMAKGDYYPGISFILNQFNILNYASRKLYISNKTNYTSKLALLYHPSDFGGLNLSTLYSHSIRGYDDKVCWWLGLFKFIQNFKPELFNKILSINKFSSNRHINYENLIDDIFSLNITSLPSIEKNFKIITKGYLNSKFVTNPEIKNLFNSSKNIEKTTLVNTLITMKPIVLSLAHEILRLSNEGIIQGLINRFSNIHTFNSMIEKITNESFLDLMNRNNYECRKIIKLRMKSTAKDYYGVNLFNYSDCPTALAKKIRFDHWNLDMIGEVRPNPYHQVGIKKLDECTEAELKNSIVIQCSEDLINLRILSDLKKGKKIPYIGSSTNERVLAPKMEAQAKTQFSKALLQLTMLRTWMARLGCNNLVTLITILINEKTKIKELSVFKDLPEEDWGLSNYGGNLLHRFRSTIERNSALLNFLPTIASHFNQSTNFLGENLSKGGKDHTLHFQLLFITNMISISDLITFSNCQDSQYCSVIKCDHCTEDITQLNFDISTESYKLYEEYTKDLPPVSTGFSSVRDHLSLVNIPDISKVLNSLSIHLGRLIGLITEQSYSCNYESPIGDLTLQTVGYRTQVSVNDLRYTNFHYLIVGILQTSFELRSAITEDHYSELTEHHWIVFDTFSKFLHDAKLVNEFLIFTKSNGYNHSELINYKSNSNLIYRGILHYCRNNFQNVIKDYLKCNFKDDNYYQITERFKFINYLVYKKLIIPENKELFYRNKITFRGYKPYQQCFLILKSLYPRDGNNLFIYDFEQSETTTVFRKICATDPELVQTTKELNNITQYDPLVRNMDELSDPNYLNSLVNDLRLSQIKNTWELIWESFNKFSSKIKDRIDIKNIHHLLRPYGNISSSFSKIWEILCYINNYINLDPSSVETVYCLAEGSGGILEGLGKVYPSSKLFYNTLINTEIDPRPTPDSNYPPAVMNSKYVGKERLKNDYLLSMGETNILKSSFYNKLVLSFQEYSPHVFTCDAENKNEENNGIFIHIYFGLLSRFNCKLIIFKLFLDKELMSNLTQYFSGQTKYNWFLFKPMSSNIHNKEIFCILYLKELIKNENEIPTTNQNMLNYLTNSKFISNEHFQKYTNYFQMYHTCLYKTYPYNYIFEIPTRISETIKKNNYCGITCSNLINKMYDLLTKLYDNKDHSSVKTHLIRALGKDILIDQLTYNIIFCSMYKKLGVFSVLKLINQIKLSEINIPSGQIKINHENIPSIESKTFQNVWSDSKSFFKLIYSSTSCSHNDVHQEIDTIVGDIISYSKNQYLID